MPYRQILTMKYYDHVIQIKVHMSRNMRFPTMWHVRPSKGSDQPAHTRSLSRAFASCSNILGVLSY